MASVLMILANLYTDSGAFNLHPVEKNTMIQDIRYLLSWGLNEGQIAVRVGISQQMVSYYRKKLRKERIEWEKKWYGGIE